jgi:hypothetical protein
LITGAAGAATGCEDTIADHEFQTDVDLAGTVMFHLHLRCLNVWQAEVKRFGKLT